MSYQDDDLIQELDKIHKENSKRVIIGILISIGMTILGSFIWYISNKMYIGSGVPVFLPAIALGLFGLGSILFIFLFIALFVSNIKHNSKKSIFTSQQ